MVKKKQCTLKKIFHHINSNLKPTSMLIDNNLQFFLGGGVKKVLNFM